MSIIDVHSKPTAAEPRLAVRAGLPVRVALLLVGGTLLAGCGAQFLYNRLDTVAWLYVKTQVSLEDLQSRQLRDSLRSFLEWHRRTELPRYADFAAALARDAARPLGRARIDRARLDIEALWRGSVARGAPDAARFLAGLDPGQRDELFASLAADDAEVREEFCEAPEIERRERQFKTVVESAEDWVGRLTPAQLELMRRGLAPLRPSGCAWAESRVQFRDDLREMVEIGARDADYAQRVARLLSNPEERWDPEYRAVFEFNRDAVIALLAELDAALTPRQRARLSEKLIGYARDFRALAAKPGAARPEAARP